MIEKYRTITKELKYYRSLMARSQLTEAEISYYLNLERGFEGERNLDLLLESFPCDCLIIQDILLAFNNSHFQIDTLIITPEKIYLLEVKNLEGTYYIKDDRWYLEIGHEIKNPIHQLHRSHTLLRQLIQQKFKLSYPIEAKVIFVNPEFVLFEAIRDLPIILPAQINRYLKKIFNYSSKISPIQRKLAEKLVSSHIDESPYTRIPNYTYEELVKGIICEHCCSFMSHVTNKKLGCKKCKREAHIDNCVKRSVDEYKMLFPDRKITVKAIMDWCKIVESKKTIRRILTRHFKVVGKYRYTYYQ